MTVNERAVDTARRAFQAVHKRAPSDQEVAQLLGPGDILRRVQLGAGGQWLEDFSRDQVTKLFPLAPSITPVVLPVAPVLQAAPPVQLLVEPDDSDELGTLLGGMMVNPLLLGAVALGGAWMLGVWPFGGGRRR